ncbi:BadF/BadG/BcrA/BcrD ATPase family protein [Streptomyces sp. NPDC088387]|uniref:BadF/BadG/BcrA/BcrD ATPase family protein n=1 Tax=Streptomyces sp. NPDC088387 TaxID=3365859 RepID=UPI00382831F9
MTSSWLVGVDIGGTKTHVRAVPADLPGHTVLDRVVPSDGWAVPPIEAGADWLAVRLGAVLGSEVSLASVAVGAHGCERRRQCVELSAALSVRLGCPVTTVNDAELLVPAAGFDEGIGVVVGTGAIAVATGGGDDLVRAGGWGWVLSDDGSASALVRDAARAVLRRADRGQEPDALGLALMRSVGVGDPADLAHSLSWGDGPEHWGRHGRAVTHAASEGSADARAVLAQGADGIAELVTTLADRGVATNTVVLGGGLMAQVPAYADAVRERILRAHPLARVELLRAPPVEGALRLAQQARKR